METIYSKECPWFGQYNLGDHPNDPSYSSDAVEGELLGADGSETSFNLDWTPVQPGSVVITDEDGVTAYRDNNAGGLVTAAGVKAGEINYGTGAIKFDTAPAAGTAVNYQYDNISAPVQAPEIQVKIVAAPIYARSRKLKTLYAFDAAADLVGPSVRDQVKPHELLEQLIA